MNIRDAVVYPIAGSHPVRWRIRLERFPGNSEPSSGWFGGIVLWGHDQDTKKKADAIARAWVKDGTLPEGVTVP